MVGFFSRPAGKVISTAGIIRTTAAIAGATFCSLRRIPAARQYALKKIFRQHEFYGIYFAEIPASCG
jgi:hypothetical protein